MNTASSLNMPAPGSGKCLRGRAMAGAGSPRHKAPKCPNRARSDGTYCEEHHREILAAIIAKQGRVE